MVITMMKHHNTVKRYFTESEASDVYGPSVAWFRRKRWQGDGPAFVKMEGRGGMVLYPVCELENYFSSRLRKSTSDPGPTVKTAQVVNQASKVRQIGKASEVPPVGLSSEQGQGGEA